MSGGYEGLHVLRVLEAAQWSLDHGGKSIDLKDEPTLGEKLKVIPCCVDVQQFADLPGPGKDDPWDRDWNIRPGAKSNGFLDQGDLSKGNWDARWLYKIGGGQLLHSSHRPY